MNLPEQHDTGLRGPLLAAGSIALIDAVKQSIAFQDPTLDLEDLFTISSASFSTYAFEPEYNQHLDEPPNFSHHAELFSNYGLFEAVSYFTGWDVKEVNHLSDDDFWKLIRFEVAQNRPVVTIDEAFRPGLIVAYEPEHTVIYADGKRATISPETFKTPDEAIEKWLVFARPGERAEWAADPGKQRTNVLRWASDHLNGAKEFFQDSRENYTVGADALQTILRLESENATDENWRQFASLHTSRLIHARREAERTLNNWADDLAASTDATREQVTAVADAFGGSHRALSADDAFSVAYRNAALHEQEAARRLQELVSVFPSIFG